MMDKKYSRRSVLKGAVIFAGASLLASCAPKTVGESTPSTGTGSETTPPPAESKEVVYWTQWASGYPDALWVELKQLLNTEIMGNYEASCIRN
jgi:hypothetical protein